MKTATSKDNGIRFSVVTIPRGLREEPVMADAPSAASVWANQRQKAKYTNGLDSEHPSRPRRVASVEGNKKARVPWDKAVPAEHFLESAPLD